MRKTALKNGVAPLGQEGSGHNTIKARPNMARSCSNYNKLEVKTK